MTQQTHKAAIVGLTGIGARRLEEASHLPVYGKMPRSHAAAYYRHPQTDLVGVCDIRQEALDDFKETWHDVWPDLRYYTDHKKMLKEEEPELISVVTSDHLHADITIDAAESGVRAISCEKPIATTLADADRMIAATEANDVLLSIEHTRRWDPKYLEVRELIHSGEIGSLRTITTNMLTPRAMLFRNGTHTVDTLCFFADSDPQWVFAELEEGFGHYTEYRGDGGHDPSSEPSVSSYIHFANGVRAYVNSAKTSSLAYSFELACDDGLIQISDTGATLVRSMSHPGSWSSPITPGDYLAEFQLAAIAELVHVIENGGDLVSPPREARKSLDIMLAMLKSHHLGNHRVDRLRDGA